MVVVWLCGGVVGATVWLCACVAVWWWCGCVIVWCDGVAVCSCGVAVCLCGCVVLCSCVGVWR